MSLASSAILSEAAKQLSVEWEQTSASWRDAKAQEFHDTFLAQIPDLVNKGNAAINDAEILLRRVRQDCGEMS
jgi:hypothetical protein